jgi:hypothetical protein
MNRPPLGVARIPDTVKSARVPDEEHRTVNQSASQQFHADTAARGEIDAKFTDGQTRDMATRQPEMTKEVLATAAAPCGTFSATTSREDLEE